MKCLILGVLIVLQSIVIASSVFAATDWNVIVIVPDDHSRRAMGAYGDSQAVTPNFDKLAGEGVLFNNAYAAAPVCSPSRAALLSGKYPSQVGVNDFLMLNDNYKNRGLDTSAVIYPQILKRNGFTTGMIGKWHLGTAPERHPLQRGFDYFVGYEQDLAAFDPTLDVNGEMIEINGHTSDIFVKYAKEFLNANKNNQFSLNISFREPQRPWEQVPQVDLDAVAHIDPIVPKRDGVDTAWLKKMTKDNYGAIHALDRAVGEVLAEVERLGIADKTIIFYVGDHGMLIGHHGYFGRGAVGVIAGDEVVGSENIANLYDEAIKINSNFISAKYNRGLALRSLGEIENSIKTFKEIIKTQPKHLQSFYELALIYRSLKNYNLAVNYSEQILKIEPTHNKANLLSIKIRKDICDWACYGKDYSYAIEKINNDEESIGPFSSIVFFDDLALQKKSSEIHTSINYPPNDSFNNFIKYNNHKKIRIAYFSPDFCNHPVSNLIVELIEKHDKSLFEIYGFSLVNRPDDEMTIRLKKAFTKFINVGNESAKNIVQLSRDMEIDISIDLAVYTGQNKSEIFSMRTAPIQINYLGFASTSGANYYDYIISDSIVIPDDYQKYYNEKILYLDVIYPNDTKRAQVKKIFDRNYFNLPNDCFIFCSINNNYKYNPYMFDSWMKILNKVEGSILFLRADNVLVKENLRKEALARGINPNRLLFSEKLNYSEYLERLSLMDLFLDTYPFNGHSTSCDALWAGLPIVTLIGDTYGSRVCASLLCSVKLDSLITYSINDYENLAIKLANEPQELKKLKKILINPLSLDLFNIIKFTKDIEDGYQKIYTRHQSDLGPAHIK